MVTRQKWSGLAIKDFGGNKGQGVVATRKFPKGSMICDYRGKVITRAEVQELQTSIQESMCYLFFFKAGGQQLCIDAQTFPCECHPDMDTFGQKINHSRKH
uniref:histone-lysine N-methyltransferase pr-set7-like n=1 Tax=Monopterus albus TaxID=43700 RepID=UPI0009B407D2|nr:histone-lysine N-methyltransferase pr-set7-like [Monopterus albus]